MATLIILIIAVLIVAINIPRMQHQDDPPTLYECREGSLRGVRTINDWRKIAVDLARTTKNSKMYTTAKYATDEELIGLLYINYGVDLFEI